MISLDLRVFENGQQGLQVRAVARGEAKSPREQIYFSLIQPAVQQALVDAGAECERQGLSAPLTEEFKAAAKGEVPSPLSGNAVEVKLPGTVPCFVPRPPSFPEFVFELAKDFRETAVIHKQLGPAGEDRALLIGAMIDVLSEKAQRFIDDQVAFIAHMKRQAQPPGGN